MISPLRPRRHPLGSIGPNAVVIGGGLYPADSNARRGFIRILARDKGTVLSEKTFDSPLTYDGLAVAAGKIYATFTNGTTVCLEGEKH